MTDDKPDMQVMRLTVTRYADDDATLYTVLVTECVQVSGEVYDLEANDVVDGHADARGQYSMYAHDLHTALDTQELFRVFYKDATWVG